MQEIWNQVVLFLSSPEGLSMVGVTFAALWAVVKAKFKLSEGKNKKITSIIDRAVLRVHDKLVLPVKVESGGKLSLEAAQHARRAAWDEALNIAKKEGFNLAKAVAKDYGPVLIEKAVARFKAGKVGSE